MGSKVTIGRNEAGLPRAWLWRDGKIIAQGDFDRFSQNPDGRIRVYGTCDFANIEAEGLTTKGALTALAQAAYQAEIDWKAGRI